MMKIYIVAAEVRVDWIRGCCKATTDGLMALCTTRRPSAHSKKEEKLPECLPEDFLFHSSKRILISLRHNKQPLGLTHQAKVSSSGTNLHIASILPLLLCVSTSFRPVVGANL
jgi:hypothetical protein